MSPITANSRLAFAAGVRQQNDRVTGEPVLLAPEGIVVLNPTAHDIVSRCDGHTTVEAIVAALAAEYDAPAESLREDVVECLTELLSQKLLSFAP